MAHHGILGTAISAGAMKELLEMVPDDWLLSLDPWNQRVTVIEVGHDEREFLAGYIDIQDERIVWPGV